MEIDITLIVVFLVGLAFGAFSKLIDFLGAHWVNARGRVPSEWEWLVNDLIETGVRAAEQVYGKHESAAKDKYDMAFRYVSEALKDRGLKISETQIQVLIEAKVQELFGSLPKG